jgi:hypothetical protein
MNPPEPLRSACRVAIAAGLMMTATCAFAPGANARALGLAERIAARRAIEQVYWNHRIWPRDNPGA